MRPRLLPLTTWAAAVAAVAVAVHTEAASTRHASLRVQDGVVINSRAGYYFSLPDGWVLDSASNYENVKVTHPDSGTVFTIDYDRARGTPTMYYFSLLWSLESPDNHWLTFGKGSVKLGGRDAWGFVGTRERDGRKVKEFMWAALVDEYVYLLSSVVDLAKIDQRAPDIDRMFSTFSWGEPRRAS